MDKYILKPNIDKKEFVLSFVESLKESNLPNDIFTGFFSEVTEEKRIIYFNESKNKIIASKDDNDLDTKFLKDILRYKDEFVKSDKEVKKAKIAVKDIDSYVALEITLYRCIYIYNGEDIEFIGLASNNPIFISPRLEEYKTHTISNVNDKLETQATISVYKVFLGIAVLFFITGIPLIVVNFIAYKGSLVWGLIGVAYVVVGFSYIMFDAIRSDIRKRRAKNIKVEDKLSDKEILKIEQYNELIKAVEETVFF